MRSNHMLGGMGLGALLGAGALSAIASPFPTDVARAVRAQPSAPSRGTAKMSLKRRSRNILRSYGGGIRRTKKMKGGLYKGSTRAKNATRRGGNQAAH